MNNNYKEFLNYTLPLAIRPITPLSINKISLPKASLLAKTNLPFKPKLEFLKRENGPGNFILFDDNYIATLKEKAKILANNKTDVLGYTKLSEKSCRELFICICLNLKQRYPSIFTINIKNYTYTIVNNITNITFRVENVCTHNVEDLLLIISKCVIEDFSILLKKEGTYTIEASLSTTIVGWIVSERLGQDVITLHRNAPKWVNKGAYAKYYLNKFNQIKSDKLYTRSNFFVVNTPALFLPSIFEGDVKGNYELSNLIFRREIQNFYRLPITGSIVFSVRTLLQPMAQSSYSDIVAAKDFVDKWSTEQANYHNKDLWYHILVKYIKDNKKD